MVKNILILVCVVLAVPALIIGSFNILNEAGQWGLAMMPHSFETYGAVGFLLAVTSVRLNWSQKEKPTIVVLTNED